MLPYSSSSSVTRPPIITPPQKPFYKRPALLLGGSLGLIALAGIAFATYYILFRQPLPEISLQLSKPEQVLLGEPFAFTVAYSNASDQNLQDVVVAVTVPEGMAVIGADPSARVVEQNVGEVAAQGIGSKVFQLIAIGNPESVKHVSVAFRYRVGDRPGPAFEKTTAADLSIGAPALALNFNVPGNVFAGQSFDIGLSYQNNSNTSLQNAKLIFQYPESFRFESASTSPSGGNNEWSLGTLSPGATGEVTLTGSIPGGQRSSFFEVGVHLQIEVNGHTYDLGTQTARLGLPNTPLTLAVAVNGKQNYVAGLGERLTYTLTYRNASTFTLKDIVVKTELAGEMLRFDTLESPATLNSVENTLTWNTATTPSLSTLAPGATGSVKFTISLMEAWPLQDPGDKNFEVQLKGRIQSLSVPAGITADETVSATTLTTKIGGQASIYSSVYFNDPELGASNQGPYPPRVNQATQYTVHWQIRNYSTDLANVHVAALLQSGAKMVKVIRTTVSSSPAYDSRTGQVTWDIPSIAAGQGATGEPVEAIFQIEATPAVNQVGRYIPLVGQTTLTARDTFTSMTITSTADAQDSSLKEDDAFGGERKVQP